MAEPAPPDKLSVIVYAGEYDKIHYALATAAAAAAIGRAATLFFTMDAIKALGRDEAWRDLPVSQGNTKNGGIMDDRFDTQGVATFEALISACVEMEVTFMVCEMGIRARGLEGMSIRDDVPVQAGGLVTFLNDASKDGAIIFI
ncbi:MAG: DsrE family protein [Rhodospirillales bacterium]